VSFCGRWHVVGPPPAIIGGVTRGRLLLTLAVVALAAGVPLAMAMQSKTLVKVTEKEFKVTPVPVKAPPGFVNFKVKNTGALKHEFIVLKSKVAAGKLPVKNNKAVLKGTVKGKLASVAPGQTKTLTVKLAAGKYILLCNLPAHYKAGQHSAFTVK
jgi:uncharacterized cupredoxin-like copper-binding protein